MRTSTHGVLLAGVIVAAACGTTDRLPSGPLPPPPASTPTVLEAYFMDTLPLFPDMRRWVHVTLDDQYGQAMKSTAAVVTSSDSALARIENVDTVPTEADKVPVEEAYVLIHFLAAGTTTLHVVLGQLAQDLNVTTLPLPAPTPEVSVDSFTVIQTPGCASCDNMYDPILRLRASGTDRPVDIIAAQVTLPTVSSDFCSGTFTYQPGQTANLIYYPDPSLGRPADPNAPSIAFQLQGEHGSNIPFGPATARVIVRDGYGRYGLVVATGSMQDGGPRPALPLTTDPNLLAWSCR